MISFDIAEYALLNAPVMALNAVARASSEGGQTMVSSVSLGHITRNSEVGGGRVSRRSRDVTPQNTQTLTGKLIVQ